MNVIVNKKVVDGSKKLKMIVLKGMTGVTSHKTSSNV